MGAITDNLNQAYSYTIGNCTRFVAGVFGWVPAGLGNANQWLSRAAAKGLPTIGPTSAPPIGSVAVWGTGEFGHVAAVTGQVPGGFTVQEENFSNGLGGVDARTVTGAALSGLQGFILPPGSNPLAALPNPLSGLPNPLSGVPNPASAAAAVAGLPAAIGHGLANALSAGVGNTGTFFRNQLVPLLVALTVAIVLFGGDESQQ